MDTTDSSPSRPEVVAGDPFAHAGGCFTCYDGVVYIGHLDVDPETGDEIEVVESVPCRRCS